MAQDVFTRKDELENKDVLREIYFRTLDAAIPKYITHANQEISYYFDVRRDIETIFDEHYGKVDATTFFALLEGICEKHQSLYLITPRGREYLDMFNKTMLLTTHDYLYNNQFSHLIDYYEDRNKELDVSMTEQIKDNIHKLRDKKKQQKQTPEFIHSIQVQLQELRERFGVEILVAKNIAWHKVKIWADNMLLVLTHNAKEMGMPEYNYANERLTIICCDDYKAVSGFFSHLGTNKEFIQVCLSSLENMNRTWLHEYTHYLDYKAGEFYLNKTAPGHQQMYLSEYLLFNQISETSKDDNAAFMIDYTKDFLRLSLGIKDKNFIRQMEIAQERIERLKDYFYISMFETIGLKYSELPKNTAMLYYENYDFMDNLLSKIYRLPFRNHQHFIEEFTTQKNIGLVCLRKNILSFYDMLGLSVSQALEMEKSIEKPEFIAQYIKHAKQFFSHEGIIHFNKHGEHAYIKCEHEFVKRSLLTEKPHYWSNVIEMVARTIEIVNDKPQTPERFLDRFKILGSQNITQRIDNPLDILYPAKTVYNIQLKSTIKQAFKHMFQYVNHELSLLAQAQPSHTTKQHEGLKIKKHYSKH